ncbi:MULTISPECIES: citrate lyase acyl carrier protein [unclassified Lactobacillus]|jgi:citrate lyase subunit gamma (acyl carrier protein)|uniref:citrate lyase acyl carrier protein n=1 Tax=unclassified Lactobacillus TaxID=2620435 RepID=UPI000EFBB079|nr:MULTISPECIES: citrate lyase acyl carrier protein [unclassified Lactobacillus]RMC24381.1 citrate lyase acyl carrier protein [Lactobacillus sp. ESL0247]RMC28520.1 citrate lyase acyl carrier protein [Lactobacillus sp. ESL0246]RMC31711.1 citrate lyase acyl carrier protein [Lactobacillus sp. ESL0245]RMC48865.1 citrate lyase acyl carrier protein [Lactobacillus sp. ESL0228]
MEIKTIGVAGTLESSDIQIMITQGNNGIEIDLESEVIKAYGEQIKKVIIDTLTKYGIENAKVKATDKGALDCVIAARTLAAAQRATETSNHPELEVL